MYYDEVAESSTCFDSSVGVLDLIIQTSIAALLAAFWLTKLGIIDLLSAETEAYEILRKMGLTHSVSLISMFVISHLNQSRYTGVNSLDWWQYFLIRMLSAALPLLVVV